MLVKRVFPEVAHSFCVFHQLKNVSKRYYEEFNSIEEIPDNDRAVYNEICQLIRSDTVISAVAYIQEYENLTLIWNFQKRLIKRFLMQKRFSRRM